MDAGVGRSAHLQTGHQVEFVLLGEGPRILGLRFPVVLRHIAVPVLDHAAFGHVAYAIDNGVAGVFTGEIGVLLSHLLGHRVIDLQSELGVEAQPLHRLVVEVEDRLDRPCLERVLRVVQLLEVVVVQHVAVPLTGRHVGIVEIAAVGVVGRQIGVHHAGVARGVGKDVRVRNVGVVLVLSHEYRCAEAEVFQQVVIGLQREVQTLEARADSRSLLIVIAAREVVAGLVAAARDAETVLLVERHLINFLAPVGPVLTQGVDCCLRFGRK